MTNEEKEVIRDLKAEAVYELQQESRSFYLEKYKSALVDTDARIATYCFSVIDNPEEHNVYEVLGIRRFFKMLDKYAWDKKKVKQFFKCYEILKLSGTSGRRRYKLTPIQCFQFANIYGLKDANGKRLIRTAYIFVPRKFSKTTSAAVMAVYDMLFGDNNAQAYVGANSYEQAKICFDEIRAILRGLDPSERHLRVNREKITFKDPGRDSLIRCLTANAKTQDGLFASLVIMDEYAQARDTAGKNGADLKNVLTSSMGPRREPLTLIITTASEVVDGPFFKEFEGVLKVLRGEMEVDSMFASVFMPDVDDFEGDPKTWRKVQPHLGTTVQPDYYEREWENSNLSAENKLTFRTKLLNIFAVNEEKSWISSEFARRISIPMPLNEIKGRPDAMVAIDLSESDDFSAVTIGMYDGKKRIFYFHTSYFFPEEALAGHPNERMYRIWVENGHLILTPGAVIDYRVIVDYVLMLNGVAKILGIGYDPYKSTEVVNMLSAAGAENVLKGVRQTYGNFTAPVESFEHGVKTGHVFINDNPINAYCFGNAVLDTDNLDNCKPVKRSRHQKIDGVITMLMDLRLFIDYER